MRETKSTQPPNILGRALLSHIWISKIEHSCLSTMLYDSNGLYLLFKKIFLHLESPLNVQPMQRIETREPIILPIVSLYLHNMAI